MTSERKIKINKILRRTVWPILATAAISSLGGCKKASVSQPETSTVAVETQPFIEETEVVQGIAPLTLEGPEYQYIERMSIPETEPAPEYLLVGVKHENVALLQARLMELGFMENDEPTDYYGNVTEAAVKSFQRQNELAQDGIVGSSTWEAIMTPDAKYYAVSNGVSGDDIKRIQVRLYELGYLATADLVTGNFGDTTEAAVIKLQEVNGLEADGKVGQKTLNLMYSDEIKPNMLAFGEKSEVVLASQNRLKELGYMTSEPDGAYGSDTTLAVKQFQSRNDLVVDGYLGPSTRIALNDSGAIPNGLGLGEQGEIVERVQQMLNKYGYLASSHVTGYYGEVTENAVKSFQSRNGLSADGSVGTLTMAKLTGENVTKAPANSGSSGSSGGSSGKSSSGNKNSGGSSGGSSGGGSSPGGTYSGGGGGASSLIAIASSKVGSPYVWGAKGPNSFDCSGFVYWCLNQAGVKQSYLTSSGWRNVGKYTKITSVSNLQAGDIIVVSGHVGIVAGGGTVIDASSSNGKVVHRSLSGWWSNNFICGWRIFG